MEKEYRLVKAYGKNDYKLADLPNKVSGITISRIVIAEDTGCSFFSLMDVKQPIVTLQTGNAIGKSNEKASGNENELTESLWPKNHNIL